MKLFIDNSQSIADLQAYFSACFPLLKIEFFEEAQESNDPFSYACQINPKRKLGSVGNITQPGFLEISSCDTTGKIEQQFKERFGLHVQVFRNENNGWIRTSSTDPFYLKEQCDMADHAKHSIFPKFREQYREYGEL